MTPRRNTKEDILQASLRLFARAGFEATGMREIAAAVGIQPASVYKHFACKQAILDALVRRMDERYELAPELGALYRRYFIEAPLAWQETLFASMVESGAFVRDDPKMLALEFFAPLMMLIQAADGATDAAARERLVDLARQHVIRFGERHACAPNAEGPE